MKLPPEAEELLDSLDKEGARKVESNRREADRQTWRKSLKVRITQPGGDSRSVEVVTRNLSSGGISFLTTGYLHLGTRCELQLVTSDGAWIDARGTVVNCRYIAGRYHEAHLRFDEPIDETQFATQTLSAKVLVVDDSGVTLHLTEHYLARAGANVMTANRGEQVPQLIADHDFDAILLDVEMPGMRGPDVAKLLRERGITVPIIAFTGLDDAATREECLAAGCSDVLVKPLGKDELIEALNRYLAVDKPIVSSLADNPEMFEFITEFVQSLPETIRAMRQSVEKQDAKALNRTARQLMIAASSTGGCGFAEVESEAKHLVQSLAGDIEWASIEGAFSNLCNLMPRVTAPAE